MHFILHSEFICQKAALLKNKNKKTHINCFFLSLVLTINIGCQDIFNNFINMLTLSNLVPLHTDYCTSFTAFPTFWCQAISTGFKSHPYLRGCSNRKVRRGLNALDFGLALSSKAISKILLIVILCIGFLKYLASTFLFFLQWCLLMMCSYCVKLKHLLNSVHPCVMYVQSALHYMLSEQIT